MNHFRIYLSYLISMSLICLIISFVTVHVDFNFIIIHFLLTTKCVIFHYFYRLPKQPNMFIFVDYHYIIILLFLRGNTHKKKNDRHILWLTLEIITFHIINNTRRYILKYNVSLFHVLKNVRILHNNCHVNKHWNLKYLRM